MDTERGKRLGFSAMLLAIALTVLTSAPLPARCVGGLFSVQPRTADGRALDLYTDTGGGLFVTAEAVRRLGLATGTRTGEDGKPAAYARLPAFAPGAAIPWPPAGDRIAVAARESYPHDGMLGQAWFADGIWTFDYARGRLSRDAAPPPDADGPHTVPLGFPVDGHGRRRASFPRIRIAVDGEAFDVLLDTGAQARVSAPAYVALGDRGPRTRATSFIVATRYRRWRRRHPDWREIPRADPFGYPMIRVPAVTIAGYTVGPVWFTARDDSNFHEFMSSLMDARVEGAIGGSALGYLEMTVDYPRARVTFRPPAAR